MAASEISNNTKKGRKGVSYLLEQWICPKSAGILSYIHVICPAPLITSGQGDVRPTIVGVRHFPYPFGNKYEQAPCACLFRQNTLWQI